MFPMLQILLHCLWIIPNESHLDNKTGLSIITENILEGEVDFYKTLIDDMRTEREFGSILVVGNYTSLNRDIHAIFELNVAKIIDRQQQIIDFMKIYNNNILAVIVMAFDLDEQSMESLAFALNHMRQTRILVIALNIQNSSHFKEALLKSCDKYKMTNVIIHFSIEGQWKHKWFLLLRPYPKYYWQKIIMKRNNLTCSYYKQHWRNMEKSTLLTLPDQYLQNSVIYMDDSQGRMKLNGIAARLVLLFVEIFNASLKMAYDVHPGEAINLLTFANLTQQDVVNIPMSYYPIYEIGIFARIAYPMQMGRIHIMIPRAQQMLVKDVFGILISKECFACVVVSILLFSLMHTIIDYVYTGSFVISNIFLNENVITGVLGQTLALNLKSMATLKIIYWLIFLLGLNLSTLYGAHLKTLVTSPPFHPQIKTLYDLTNSSLKLLFDSEDVTPASARQLKPFKSILVYAPNTTAFQNTRKSLNTLYAYTVPASLWAVFEQQQAYFVEKLFCISPDLATNDFRLYAMILGQHSPFKEPLDYLIHHAQAMGLTKAWHSSAFLDMIKYKNITRSHLAMSSGYRDLNEDDLWWIWMVLLIGLTTSIIVFSMELIVEFWQKMRTN